MPEKTQHRDRRAKLIAAADPKHGLWHLVPSPLVAALHFTIVYIGSSVYCIRSETGDLDGVRVLMALLTVISVAVIGVLAWIAWRRLRLVRTAPEASSERRDEVEFLARITLYLAHLSWIGVLFVAAPLVFFGACT